jgi:cytochrome c oxidase subunit 2
MGERVATEKGCMRCHTVDGTPHIGPTWLGMYGSVVPLSNGREIMADAAYLTDSMMDPRALIHRGYPPVMPSYQGLLSAPQTGAILEYLRALARPPATTVNVVERAPLVAPDAPPIRLPDELSAADAGAIQENP